VTVDVCACIAHFCFASRVPVFEKGYVDDERQSRLSFAGCDDDAIKTRPNSRMHLTCVVDAHCVMTGVQHSSSRYTASNLGH
jgi:hypothetical protein